MAPPFIACPVMGVAMSSNENDWEVGVCSGELTLKI
jgi:hypothetical protein